MSKEEWVASRDTSREMSQESSFETSCESSRVRRQGMFRVLEKRLYHE
ncbi:MAG: hypothetical protein IMX04_00950, partial [Candidatus Carbobacillus altaicus]|nr:hypothetical protein [Candidatus Carbobacillus altaicus]